MSFWNCGSLRTAVRKNSEIIRRWIEKTRPDIMFILDEKVIDETMVSFDNVLPLKYRSFFHVSTKKKGYSGVAVFIRQSGN